MWSRIVSKQRSAVKAADLVYSPPFEQNEETISDRPRDVQEEDVTLQGAGRMRS